MGDDNVRTIVWVRFNTYDRADRDQPNWYPERFRLLRTYAIASLLRQSLRDWECWLLCSAAHHRFTNPLEGFLPDDRFHVVYNAAAEIARVAGHDRYVIARLDSDDMYGRDVLETFVAHALDMPAGKTHVQLEEGWCYDERDGRLYVWQNPSPAFFCRVQGPEWIRARNPGLGHHGKIRPVSVEVMGPRFCVVLHPTNISNCIEGPWIGPEVTGPAKGAVLAEYGLEVVT